MTDDTDVMNAPGQAPVVTPSEFVALTNNALEYTFPSVMVVGELSSYRVSKGKWVYFDIKDDESSVKCFGTVYQVRTVLEEGMQVQVTAAPRLHNLYGFSLNVSQVQPVGEGSIKKAADLLRAQLEKEGLFSPKRKRLVPDKPTRIGLVASEQSAAYADFIKILNQRWAGVDVVLFDAQVQGDAAPQSIIAGVRYFNEQPSPPEVIVVTRGGGSADDLSAFSDEYVVRAVAGSRVPTVVAIGHEIDVSLAELAADMRASTPSNAAELLFPDKAEVAERLQLMHKSLQELVGSKLQQQESRLSESLTALNNGVKWAIEAKQQALTVAVSLLKSSHPSAALQRGYALVEVDGKLASTVAQLPKGTTAQITLQDGSVETTVQ